MRITFLLNRDPASAYALNALAPKLSSHKLRVFYSDKPSQVAPVPERLVDLAVFEKVQLAELNSIFTRLNAERLNNVNSDDFERFKHTQPDLVISIRHMSILQPASIAIPKHGVINLHSGLLPDYQGVMATFWAMKNREPEIGTSLHFIEDANIDTGSIISQSRTAVNYDESYFWNVMNIYRGGCENIVNAVTLLSNSTELTATPQVNSGNYFGYPSSEDLSSFAPKLFSKHDLRSFL